MEQRIDMDTAKDRLKSIANQLTPSSLQQGGRAAILSQNPDDVVITFATRSPLTKARKGLFRDTPVEDLVIELLKVVNQQSNIDPGLVEHICLGNVLAHDAAYLARTSTLAAGYPVTTSCSIASRWCSSGLLAVQTIANEVATGTIDVGIAVGAESMSMNPDKGAPTLSEKALSTAEGRDCTMPMGWTSENVAGDFGITRNAQDAFAAESQRKAAVAKKEGWTKDEISPIPTTVKDPKTGETQNVLVTEDEGIREDTTPEGLSKLRAAFPKWQPATTTGGNASQITDGAAAVLLMKRRLAHQLGQPIIGKFVASTVIGLEPRIMGIGPSLAIPKLLKKLDLPASDVDIFEINEAFASMAVYCQEKLQLDPSKLNPRGGAIALGHPLACTGARQIVTALSELRRRKEKVAVTSMCVGTGHAMAAVIVSEN